MIRLSSIMENTDYILPTFSFEDIQINLRLLGDLQDNEKIIIDDKFMMVDNRLMQSVRRKFSSDSRDKTIEFIDHLIDQSKKISGELVDKISKGIRKTYNLEMLILLHSLLSGSLRGINKLSKTYEDDKLNKSKMETIKDKIIRLCDTDMKKATSNNEVENWSCNNN